MFYVKKIISQLIYPMPFCLGLGIVGVYLLWFSTRQKAGKIVTSLSIGLLVLFGYGLGTDAALELIEYRYPQYQIHDSTAEYIVVLGGGRSKDERLSITNQLNQSAMVRLMEGIRIYKNQPGSKLIFSGKDIGVAMTEAALIFGVNKDDILYDNKARDTMDEAENISKMIGKKPVILVSSASHLVRAVALFEKYGLTPHPAPTDFQVRNDPDLSVYEFFPRTRSLLRAEIAIHEYAGIAWGKIRSWI